MKTKLLLCIAIVTFFSPSFAQNIWTQKANIGSTYGKYCPAGFSIGTNGYVGTGRAGSAYYKDFWVWNQSTNVWTQKADFGGNARSQASGFAIGAKGYIGLGYDGSCYKDIWEYDTTTNVWTQKGDFPDTARFGAAAFVIGNKAYVGCGLYYDGNTNPHFRDFWEYNPATDTWTQKANFGGSVRYGGTGFSVGTKGYFACGMNYNTYTDYNDFWEYDQATNIWTQKTSYPGIGRFRTTGFSLGTCVYLGTGSGNTTAKDFWEWNQTTNTWVQKADCSGTPRYGAIGLSIAGRGYIGMGYDNNSNALFDFWEYSTTTATPEIAKMDQIYIFPNPAISKLQIEGLSKGNIEILNAHGQFVRNIDVADCITVINVSNLPTGVYFIKLMSDNKITTKKFIKE